MKSPSDRLSQPASSVFKQPATSEQRYRCSDAEAMIRERMRRAQKEGELSSDRDADAIAKYVATLTLGMAVQAASGASREQLRQIAETTLRAWPTLAGS